MRSTFVVGGLIVVCLGATWGLYELLALVDSDPTRLQTAGTLVGAAATVIATVIALAAARASRNSARVSAAAATTLLTSQQFSRPNKYLKDAERKNIQASIDANREELKRLRQVGLFPEDAPHLIDQHQHKVNALEALIARDTARLNELELRNARPAEDDLDDSTFEY